jgi:uncharacterized repeat protein (TIGR03803 family)
VKISTKSLAAALCACLFLVLLAVGSAHGTDAVIYNFTGGSAGMNPSTGLIFDAAGNLYGGTTFGGSGPCGGGCGTVFRLTPGSSGTWTQSVVYNFQGFTAGDGMYPSGALISDTSGNLFGVTSAGGARNCGTVFELTPGSGGSWTESVLHSFHCGNQDGTDPVGKLVFDSSGNLRGVTLSGGAIGGGTVFEMLHSSGGWTESVIYSFSVRDGLLGKEPTGIIFDAFGNLYGVTQFGGIAGATGAGVIFQLVQNSGVWTEKDIYRFPVTGTALQTPTGGLIFDSAGNLYMSMGRGGNGGTGVFRLNPVTGATKNVYTFKGPQTVQPYEGLTFDAAGNLYGASYVGGGNCINGGCGFVYKLSPTGNYWTPTILANLNGSNGAYPQGGVVLDGVGNVYGTAFSGGSNRNGVVFQIVP